MAGPADAKADTVPLPRAATDASTASPGAPAPSASSVDVTLTTAVLGPSSTLPERVGSYEVLGELGRGGMGIVYRARDPASAPPREVAVKLILDPLRVGAEETRRFKREAAAAARLRHPGIVAVLDTGEHEGRPFFVMELVPGQSLEAHLRAAPRDLRQIAEIARGVAEALAYAHEQGVIHRDVKPDNVLLDAEGRPRLMDFGLARDVAASAALTISGQILGTPAYMAPEQARGDVRSQGPCTDVHALGALLYRAMTGQPPFVASTVQAVITRVLVEEPVPPRQVDPTIPAALETLTLRCLEKEPARRYASARAVADELGRWLEGEKIHARPPTFVERAVRWARRNPTGAVLTAVLIVGLVSAMLVPGALARAREEAERVAAAKQQQEARDEAEAARVALRGAARADRDVVVRHALASLAAWERLARLDETARVEAADASLEVATVVEQAGARELAADALARARALGAERARTDELATRLAPAPLAASNPPPAPQPPHTTTEPVPAPAPGPTTPPPEAPEPAPTIIETPPTPVAAQPAAPSPDPEPATDTRPPETPAQPEDVQEQPAAPPPAARRVDLEAASRTFVDRVQALTPAAAPEDVSTLLHELAFDPAWQLGGASTSAVDPAAFDVPRLGPMVAALAAILPGLSVAEARVDLLAGDVPTGRVTLSLTGKQRVELKLLAVDVAGRWLIAGVTSTWFHAHAQRVVSELRGLLGTTPRAGRVLPPLEALEARALVVLERTDRSLRLPGYTLELRPLADDEYGLVATPSADPAHDSTWILGPLPGEFNRRENPYKVRARGR